MVQTEFYLRLGRRQEPYEETIRDVLPTWPSGTSAFEDFTGMPWIEIDFAADIERANSEVLPRILKAEIDSGAAIKIKRGKDRNTAQMT